MSLLLDQVFFFFSFSSVFGNVFSWSNVVGDCEILAPTIMLLSAEVNFLVSTLFSDVQNGHFLFQSE